MHINIRHLEIFCLVVEEGSISQAARRAYLSQPAVTRQIRQLEVHYGTPLFDRTDGKLAVTKAGKTLYQYAKTITTDFRNSEEAIRRLAGKIEPHLKIGASLTIGEYLLPEILGRFKRVNPHIKLSLKIGNTPAMLEALTMNHIHIALVEGVVEDNYFDVSKFAEDELILVCSSEHPWEKKQKIYLKELLHERMIWREEDSGTRKIIENVFKQYNMLDKIENYMELGSTQAIKAAVEANLGISILPKMSVEKELKSGTLHRVKIEQLRLKRDLWLVTKSSRFEYAELDKLIAFIQSYDRP